MINQEIQILRSEHLNQIKDGLFTTDNKDLSNLVILQGPEGIGKTTLINNLGQQLESTDNPFLWIDLAKLKEEQDLLKYPQLLSHSIQTNHPSIKSRIEEAAMELGREAFRLEAMATQASAGTAVNADPLPDLAETWSKIFSEKLLSKIKNEGESELPSPTAIFLMEDFESFSKPQQLWIKENLIDIFQSDEVANQVSYLVTTTATESGNISNFFSSDKFLQTDVELKAFTEDELADLLQKVSLPEVSPGTFLEQTQGFPLRMIEAATDLLNKDLDEDVSIQIQNFVKGKSEQQMEWLSVAVLLPEYKEEGFRLYFDEIVAKEAYEWLGSEGSLVKQASGDYSFNKEMKNNLLQWIRQKDPVQFQARNQMAGQYVKLLRKFSGKNSHEYLNHLACLNFFDSEDLEFLFGASAAEYAQFTQDNPQYFETGVRNQRINPEYMDLIKEYRALLPSSTTESLSERAQEYWSEKSTRLQEEKRRLQQRKIVEESKLNELNLQVAELDVFLNKEEGGASEEERVKAEQEERERRLEEEKLAEVNRRVKGSKRFHSIINSILILSGIVFFYFGIFSNPDETSISAIKSSPLIPCLFGVGLMATGILRPLRDKITIQKSYLESRLDKQTSKDMKKKKTKKGEEITEQPIVDNMPEELTGAEALLWFKRSKIESKTDALQEIVDELSHELIGIEHVLKEPLVA
jgi:hypothetical protein